MNYPVLHPEQLIPGTLVTTHQSRTRYGKVMYQRPFERRYADRYTEKSIEYFVRWPNGTSSWMPLGSLLSAQAFIEGEQARVNRYRESLEKARSLPIETEEQS